MWSVRVICMPPLLSRGHRRREAERRSSTMVCTRDSSTGASNMASITRDSAACEGPRCGDWAARQGCGHSVPQRQWRCMFRSVPCRGSDQARPAHCPGSCALKEKKRKRIDSRFRYFLPGVYSRMFWPRQPALRAAQVSSGQKGGPITTVGVKKSYKTVQGCCCRRRTTCAGPRALGRLPVLLKGAGTVTAVLVLDF